MIAACHCHQQPWRYPPFAGQHLPLLSVTGLLWQAFSVAAGIASVAWLKDLLPEENRGKFLGIRMIFWIAIPMVLGPGSVPA